MESHFRHFRDDPFFIYRQDLDDRFNALESVMRPYSFEDHFSYYPAIEGNNSNNNRELKKKSKRSNNFFGDIGAQFRAMQDMVNNTFSSFDSSIDPNDPNASFYSSSTVYESQYNGSDNEPHVFQAHRSVRQAPGGIREEQKAVRDTRKAEEKMSIGRYINKKGREVERRRDMRTGEHEEHKRYHEMGESESEEFDSQWDSLARKSFPSELPTDRMRQIKDRNSYSNEKSSKSNRHAIKECRRGRL